MAAGDETANSAGQRTRRPRSGSNSRYQRPKRFPDFILCGQLNLHRSAANAAALSKYIAKQWDFLRINRDGIISSHQLEINRDPDSHGGLRDGKPLTVSEWNQIRKNKLLDKRKEQADLETNLPGTSGAGARGNRGNSRGRSRH